MKGCAEKREKAHGLSDQTNVTESRDRTTEEVFCRIKCAEFIGYSKVQCSTGAPANEQPNVLSAGSETKVLCTAKFVSTCCLGDTSLAGLHLKIPASSKPFSQKRLESSTLQSTDNATT